MIFKNILLPYNGTKGSQKAFKKAVTLAQLTKSKLTILTCLEECSTFGLFKTKANRQNFERERKHVILEHAKLDEYAKKHRVSPSFKIIKSSIASRTILEYAEKHKTDLIVLGRKKMTRYEKIHFPSTIEDISKNFDGALLIIN